MTIRPLLALGVVILCLAVGGAAYAIGASSASDTQDAVRVQRHAEGKAFRSAKALAERSARQRGKAKGMRAGTKVGRIKGKRTGASAGTAIAEERTAAAEAVEAEEAAAEETTARAEAEENLPPGYVPYPSTSPAPSGNPGIDPGCYSVEDIPCD